MAQNSVWNARQSCPSMKQPLTAFCNAPTVATNPVLMCRGLQESKQTDVTSTCWSAQERPLASVLHLQECNQSQLQNPLQQAASVPMEQVSLLSPQTSSSQSLENLLQQVLESSSSLSTQPMMNVAIQSASKTIGFNQACEISLDLYDYLIGPSMKICYADLISNYSSKPNSFALSFPHPFFANEILNLSHATLDRIYKSHFLQIFKSQLLSLNCATYSPTDIHKIAMDCFLSLQFS